MRKINLVLILFLLGGGTLFAAAPTAETARNAGDIRGRVIICELLGIDRVTAYIPGHSYMARPAVDGSLEFSFVPPGTYEIVFEAPSGETVSTVSGVVVVAKQQTELGEISICIDADNDGFDATLDCNDSNGEIYPGASEVCNLIDDDCDTTVDEGFVLTTFYRDSDNDSWGDQTNSWDACQQPIGYVQRSGDCYDQNDRAYPYSSSFSTGHRGDGSFDYDCNNVETKRFLGGSYCTEAGTSCVREGGGFWVSSPDAINTEPDCGATADQHLGCYEDWGGPLGTNLTCGDTRSSTTQQCR